MFNPRYGSRGAATSHFLGGMSATANGNFIGVFAHAGAMGAAMRQNGGNRVAPSPEVVLQQQKQFLISKLQEAKSRLARGKQKLHALMLGPIKANIQELDAMENKVQEANSLDEIKPLWAEVETALGFKGGLDSMKPQASTFVFEEEDSC